MTTTAEGDIGELHRRGEGLTVGKRIIPLHVLATVIAAWPSFLEVLGPKVHNHGVRVGSLCHTATRIKFLHVCIWPSSRAIKLTDGAMGRKLFTLERLLVLVQPGCGHQRRQGCPSPSGDIFEPFPSTSQPTVSNGAFPRAYNGC